MKSGSVYCQNSMNNKEKDYAGFLFQTTPKQNPHIATAKARHLIFIM